ncbi:MAG: type II toxin-antitoxin system PemK/MazF family toxin [Clostridiaceae bacterium]|nr:type II toxin-antitoxin system PemK/MazF family toxin [Clostridiaceae bacterium]
MYVKRDFYEQLSIRKPDCFNKCDSIEEVVNDVTSILNESKGIVTNEKNKYASTWLLDKDLWIQHEKKQSESEVGTLSRGRIVLVNPGVTRIGREQRYMHNYIVLGEYKETFIGVPITNMALNKKTGKYYLRNFFEVELIDPEQDKEFSEYRCSKRSVADVRNISGLDKRRIIKNNLYEDKKFVPDTYLNAISNKIRESLAIIK